MHGQKSNFEDDCRAWISKSASTKKTIFHHYDGNYKWIELKNGEYCTMKKKEWVPLEPQPHDEDVVIMRRYYATLKRKPDYKKRVTWFEKASSQMDATCQDRAIVEYLGVFPSVSSMHGNSTKSKYIRTCEVYLNKRSYERQNQPTSEECTAKGCLY